MRRQMDAPTRAGQAVKFILTGEIGITTSELRKRSPRIEVQFVGSPYPILVELDDLEVIKILEIAGNEGDAK